MLLLLLWLLLLMGILGWSLIIPTYSKTLPNPKFSIVENGYFSTPILGNVNRSVDRVFFFPLNNLLSSFNHLETKIRVKVSTPDTTELKNAVRFAIVHGNEDISMKVPFILNNKLPNKLLTFSSSSRVLCIFDKEEGDDEAIEVRVSTHSKENTQFGLIVFVEAYMSLKLGEKIRTVISVTRPDFLFFNFSDATTNYVQVKVTAEKHHCMILAIQKADCPAFLLEENIRFQGKWLTFFTKGGLIVKKNDYPKGFFLKIIMTTEETTCTGIPEKYISSIDQFSRDHDDRVNPVTVEIVNDQFQLHGGTWTILGPPLLTFLVGVIVAVLYFLLYCMTRHTRYIEHRLSIKNAVRVNAYLRELRESRVSTRQFWKVTVFLSIFYAVPVFELTAFNLQVLHNTGDYDQCYFNNLCSYPISWIEDFNHLWSNTSFIILGMLFCCITAYKDHYCRDISKTNRETSASGIPLHFGLFYAMGLALIMEGFMSSAYHLCPNKANFPYDTCYMYIIAVLCLLKIYENRHSKHLGPNWTFSILSGLSLTSVFGIALEKYNLLLLLWIFKIILTVIHAWIAMMFLLTYLAYDSDSRTIWTDIRDFPRVWVIFPNLCRLKIYSADKFRIFRVVFVIFLQVLSIWVAFSLFYQQDDLAHHILKFLILYLVTYFLYYLAMKGHCKEFNHNYIRCWVPFLFFCATLIFGGFAYHFFRIDLTEWRKSASESRLGNEDCILHNFYDQHDLWHFLSAHALFFFFMTLLSVDDAVSLVSREELYTF